jgi:uncharacterized SAM-binding protein YcdF (DUF218 family)
MDRSDHISSGILVHEPALMLATDRIEGYNPAMSAGLQSPPLDPQALPLTSKTRRRWVALLRVIAFSAIGIVALFFGGFGVFSTYVSNLDRPAKPAADAIIVLTGGEARLDAAWHLLEEGRGRRLLISGVNPSTGRNQLRRAVGADAKLFNCCVDFDYEALDTIGNATESAEWLRKHDFDSAILVTNNYHMPRSMLELGRRTDAELTPYPVVNTPLGSWRWLTERQARRVLFFEYTKFLASAFGGDLSRALHIETASAAR